MYVNFQYLRSSGFCGELNHKQIVLELAKFFKPWKQGLNLTADYAAKTSKWKVSYID